MATVHRGLSRSAQQAARLLLIAEDDVMLPYDIETRLQTLYGYFRTHDPSPLR